jgi:hypothetical protein
LVTSLGCDSDPIPSCWAICTIGRRSQPNSWSASPTKNVLDDLAVAERRVSLRS